jgi:hypothetical protein
MMSWLRPFRIVAAIALALSLVCQGTWVLAGTTGSLSGTVTDTSTHAPIAGAKVTVTSPSQNASVVTDGSGRFNFLALAPDTYTVTVTEPGYDTSTVSGTTVIADSNRTLGVSASKTLQTIGKVTSRASTDLVKPGTTADVYSINATQQDKSAALGGGGTLNSAWSALTSVPGVFITPGQAGYIGASANISIRGGDYDQIGYEIDGVPVNRAFDNYPSGSASSLGQQELQVYTGAAPASAEAQGLSGFINQVIKTGTYPASSTITGDLGGPAYYHKFSIETGGASQDRNFSYYVGLGGYNQDFRYTDQFNGASLSGLYGTPIAPCSLDGGTTVLPISVAPSCYTNGKYNGNNGVNQYFGNGAGYDLGPYNYMDQSTIATRDSVFNLHFGIPHKNGTKDDLQLLAVINHIATQFYSATNDIGGLNFTNSVSTLGTPYYIDGYSLNTPTGGPLNTATAQQLTSIYYFPQSGTNRGFQSAIPADARDGISNNQNIFKAQYTHAIGTNALLKIYGYTYYSDWLQLAPQSTYADFAACCSGDYELSSHTRGVSATFTDQLGSSNLLTLQGSYTTASTLRDNNTQFVNGEYGPDSVNLRTVIGALVDSNDPTNGLCYTATGVAVSCALGKTTPGTAQFATIGQAYAGTIAPATGTCGTGPCEYITAGNGAYATYNTVKPKFLSVSLTDQFKPTTKLTFDAGIRLDRFEYDGSNTTGTAARTFWYNAFNLDNCVGNTGSTNAGALIARAPGAACPAGASPANFTNPTGTVIEAYSEYQPRIGATYSLTPTTVLRASYGRFAQAPNSAFQQYDTLAADAPQLLYGTYGFQKFGFTSPDHTVVPPTSNNLDFSIEHQFGSDTSVKLSPFLRKTQNQIQQFYLNQQSGFVSGLNVGNQTSQGVEFELDKGNFARDGLAAKLSLAYTYSTIKYQKLSNGTSIIDPLNAQIKDYNAYTSGCAAKPTSAPCAGAVTQNGVAAAPCYTAAGAAVLTGCTAADIANPYWNAPVQALLDPNGQYPTFDTFPAGIGTAVQGYGAPYTATLIVQYKRGKLAVTPAVQFFAGQRYGAPASTFGVAPDTCTVPLGAAAGDPRYNYGAVGGSGFDYASCGLLPGGIPDPYTGKFDTIGAFSQPSNLELHLQLSYDVTKRISVVVNLANLVNTCFGGTKTGFTVKGACDYGIVGLGSGGDVGNSYNPGAPIQPYVNTPYEPAFAVSPFAAYASLRVKL